MKINSAFNSIAPIRKQQQQRIQSESGKKRVTNQDLNISQIDKMSAGKIQPIDLLSNDELLMLGQLFPEKANKSFQSDVYLINRTKMAQGKLGSMIDIKG